VLRIGRLDLEHVSAHLIGASLTTAAVRRHTPVFRLRRSSH
jgi:hypothetical protein